MKDNAIKSWLNIHGKLLATGVIAFLLIKRI